VAEAPDFATAASFLLAQLAEVGGAQRGSLLALDGQRELLVTVATLGFPEGEAPRQRVPIDDHGHPLVLAALSLTPVCGDGRGPTRLGFPFATWIALPLAQPQFRGAPPVLSERRMAELAPTGCEMLMPRDAERRRRVGHAPLGVALLEGLPAGDAAPSLAYAAMLAGPVLSRLWVVDELRQSAQRLDQQRDLLTALLNSLPDPFVITNAANDMVVQNRRAEHLFAFGDADSEGRRRAVEINNLLFTSFLARAVMGGADSGARELNLVDPDEGTDLLFEVLAHPLSEVSRDGSFVSVLRDVTDLRRAAGELERQVQRARLAEIEARRERDRVNLILENVADPILVTDDQSNIILMNDQAEQLFELREPGTRARREMIAVRGNDTKFTTFISDFTLSQETSRREQMRLVHPESETELPIEVVSGKIVNKRGEPLAIVSVLHDLTKQVENERLYEQLKVLNEELELRIRAAIADLEAQNQRLAWQAAELKKVNQLKSDFLASMSHELRTPINALIGYTALMLDRIYGDINDRQEEGLRRIQTAAQHLLALINDILDLAKIEAGKMPLHLEEVDAAEVIGEIAQQIEPLAKKKALDFIVDVPPDAPTMLTDRTKVKQILLNLLSNAVKFTHKGSVTVRVVPQGELVRFDVADTGIGIRESDLEAIWEDFRQVDQSRTREFGGTGLGLSITKKLIAALGGRASVTSTYGEGSTFSVTLPVRTAPRGPDDRPPTGEFPPYPG